MGVEPGTEWQVRELAEQARELADRYREMGSNGARRAAYCQGVRDALRLIAGDLTPEDGPAELAAIYRRYQDAI